MSTDSTPEVLDVFRLRLLTFAPAGGGETLAVQLGTMPGAGSDGKLYKWAAQDGVTYPYSVMRMYNLRTSGDTHGMRYAGDLEVMLYHRPRKQASALERAADTCDQAMLRFADPTDGLVFSKASQRDTLPPPQAPADSELYMIRLIYSVRFWPRFLTRY